MPHAFPHQLAWLLNNRFRALLLPAKTLVARIPLTVTDHVLELGPGSGYFSVTLAAAVSEGRLELLDIQPQMLSKARARLTAAGYTNVGYTVADAGTTLAFPPGSFDVVVLVHVLGEVADQAQCLRSLHGLLKQEGVLAVHEGWPDPDRIALPMLRSVIETHGFAVDRTHGPAWNYTAIFRRV